MPAAHRDDDRRFCSARTIVDGQSTVFVNGKLWAVEGDENTHIHGRLVSVVGSTVKIEGKEVIVLGDRGLSDEQLHPLPSTDPQEASDDVNAY